MFREEERKGKNEPGDDISKDPNSKQGLNDSSDGRADHVADGTRHLDAHEPGQADEETEHALKWTHT